MHVASPLTGSNPDVAIPTAVNAGLYALKAAAKTPSVISVVYTSSSIATTFPSPGVEKVIGKDSYNEEGIQKALNHPENEPQTRGLYIYAGLKTSAEKACWKWVEENKPHFAFNSIVGFNQAIIVEY